MQWRTFIGLVNRTNKQTTTQTNKQTKLILKKVYFSLSNLISALFLSTGRHPFPTADISRPCLNVSQSFHSFPFIPDVLNCSRRDEGLVRSVGTLIVRKIFNSSSGKFVSFPSGPFPRHSLNPPLR